MKEQLRPPAVTALILTVVIAVASFYGVEQSPEDVLVDGIKDMGPYRRHLETKMDQYNITIVREDPLMYIIEDFLSPYDCQVIQESAGHMERSTGGLERSVGSYRTSTTAWINTETVTNQTIRHVLESVEKRIADILNLPVENQEHLQVLHYDVGQYYRLHSDYIHQHRTMPCGVRVATFFLYLNDVEEGGGTYFPAVNLRVNPKRGRAAVWYSAFPNLDMDARVDHEAMPVIKGEKWAANKWIHSGNFVDNWKKGLTG